MDDLYESFIIFFNSAYIYNCHLIITVIIIATATAITHNDTTDYHNSNDLFHICINKYKYFTNISNLEDEC